MTALDTTLLIRYTSECYLIAIRTEQDLTPSFSYSSALICNPEILSPFLSITSALFPQKYRGGTSRSSSPELSSIIASDPRSAPVTLLVAALTKTKPCKSFPCHTSKKGLGGTRPLCSSFECRVSPLAFPISVAARQRGIMFASTLSKERTSQ